MKDETIKFIYAIKDGYDDAENAAKRFQSGYTGIPMKKIPRSSLNEFIMMMFVDFLNSVNNPGNCFKMLIEGASFNKGDLYLAMLSRMIGTPIRRRTNNGFEYINGFKDI